MYQNPHKVAQKLLGSCICSKNKKLLVTEVEVYEGEHDLASHARHGKTPRNAAMWEEGGVWYVYLCYGIHWMLNLVTGGKDEPSAILIRGGFDESGKHINGPGRVTKFLNVSKKFNGIIANKKSGLWIEWKKVKFSGKITRSPRIGVDYAGHIWSKKHFRYVFKPKN